MGGMLAVDQTRVHQKTGPVAADSVVFGLFRRFLGIARQLRVLLRRIRFARSISTPSAIQSERSASDAVT